jgi:hypothetical protein
MDFLYQSVTFRVYSLPRTTAKPHNDAFVHQLNSDTIIFTQTSHHGQC